MLLWSREDLGRLPLTCGTPRLFASFRRTAESFDVRRAFIRWTRASSPLIRHLNSARSEARPNRHSSNGEIPDPLTPYLTVRALTWPERFTSASTCGL